MNLKTFENAYFTSFGPHPVTIWRPDTRAERTCNSSDGYTSSRPSTNRFQSLILHKNNLKNTPVQACKDVDDSAAQQVLLADQSMPMASKLGRWGASGHLVPLFVGVRTPMNQSVTCSGDPEIVLQSLCSDVFHMDRRSGHARCDTIPRGIGNRGGAPPPGDALRVRPPHPPIVPKCDLI